MKIYIPWILLFAFFYLLPEMIGGIHIDEANFGIALLLTLNCMVLFLYSREGRWGNRQNLERSIAIADDATRFIALLENKKTSYKTIEMSDVISMLSYSSSRGRADLKQMEKPEL